MVPMLSLCLWAMCRSVTLNSPSSIVIFGIHHMQPKTCRHMEEVECLVPIFIRNITEAKSRFDFIIYLIGIKAFRNRQGHEGIGSVHQKSGCRECVLRVPDFRSMCAGLLLQWVRGVGGYKINVAIGSRLVTASAGSLNKPGYTFGTANLNDGFNRPKVHTQVEARCAYHCFESAVV